MGLRTKLEREALEQFFLEEYRPTPIVAPWNGGSGFYPKDNTSAIDTLSASQAPRFAEYRETIDVAEVARDAGAIDVPGRARLARALPFAGIQVSAPSIRTTVLFSTEILTPSGARNSTGWENPTTRFTPHGRASAL